MFKITYLKFLGLPLIFLDAYTFKSIPINWIGFFIIFISYCFSKNISKNVNLIFLVLFLSLIFEISNFGSIEFTNSNIKYLILRNFNLISGILIFKNIIEDDLIHHKNFFEFQKYVALICIFITFYIYLAQIFDFYEPIRNRSNTSVYIDSAQTTFWPKSSHRALGTFREPSYLATYLFPLCLLLFKYNKNISKLFIFIAALCIGLTKSDFVEVICAIVVLFQLVFFLKNKQNFDKNILLFIIGIFIFSQLNLYECQINPQSIDCKEFNQEINKNIKVEQTTINSDININNNNKIFEFDSERFEILNYIFDKFLIYDNSGYLGVNFGFQQYLYQDTTLEMYLTNRTLPKYLLDFYPTQNFGTGRYSLLRYPINIQNKIAFYYLTYGFLFLVLLVLMIFKLYFNLRSLKNNILLIAVTLFIIINPIEEFNVYFGLILGYTYQLSYKANTYENL